jgi:hypothetical protein
MTKEFLLYAIEFNGKIEHVGFQEYLIIENLEQEIACDDINRWKIVFPQRYMSGLELFFKEAFGKSLPATRLATDKEILDFMHRIQRQYC